MWAHRGGRQLQARKRLSPETSPAGTLILTLEPPELREISSYWLRLPGLWGSVRTAGASTVTGRDRAFLTCLLQTVLQTSELPSSKGVHGQDPLPFNPLHVFFFLVDKQCCVFEAPFPRTALSPHPHARLSDLLMFQALS